jgi:hypothetical protein
MTPRFSFYLLILAVIGLPLFAADTGQILQQEQQLQQLQDLPSGIPDSLIIEEKQRSDEDTGPKVFIKNITFKGNQAFTDEELIEVIQDHQPRIDFFANPANR